MRLIGGFFSAIFRGAALIWLLAILAIGVGGSYLTHNPDAAAGVALGAATLDSRAGVLENAETFGSGYSAGSELIGELRNAEAEMDLRHKCAASEDSDWAAPRECAMLERSDTDRAARVKDGW